LLFVKERKSLVERNMKEEDKKGEGRGKTPLPPVEKVEHEHGFTYRRRKTLF